MDHQRSFEGIRSATEAVGHNGRSGRAVVAGGSLARLARVRFFFEDLGTRGSVRRGAVQWRTLLPCGAIIDVRGNHFEKKTLPLEIVLKLLYVIGEPVVHLFTRGPGKSSDIAKTYGLFLHLVEAGAVASIELLETAARARSNGNTGTRGEIVVGKDSMRLGRIRFRSGGIGCGACGILLCRILSRLLLCRRRAGGLRRGPGTWRHAKKSQQEESRKSGSQKNGGGSRA